MKFDEDGTLDMSDRDVYRTGRKWAIWIIAALVLIPAAVWGVRWVTADARGAGQARQITRGNGQFRIAAYNEFYDLCSAVQAQEDRIAIFEEDTSPTWADEPPGRPGQESRADP